MTEVHQLLNQHPFAACLSPEHVARVAACTARVSFADGEVLAREGQPADATYLLVRGRVALRTGKQIVETVEDDEVLGWSWLFDDAMWHVDAVAMGPVDALRIDGAALDAEMHADPAFGHALARCILRQVHRRLERARLRGLDVFGGG